MRNGLRAFGAVASLLAATVVISLLPLGASAGSSCKTPGKEADGCALKVGGFIKKNDPSGVTVSLGDSKYQGKRIRTTVSVPGSFLCGGTSYVAAQVSTSKASVVGSTTKVKGSASSPNGAGGPNVATKVDAKVKVTSAKKAKVTGSAEITFSDGTKCQKSFSQKLSRVLGG